MKYTEDEIFEELQKGNISRTEALELLKQINNVSKEKQTNEETSENSQEVHTGVTKREIVDSIENIVKNILHYDEGEIDRELTFKDLGFDSISGAEIVRDINELYELGLDSSILYDYSTIDLLAEYIENEKKK
jgi:polyketide synthase PksN